jgi:hypothetical protein
MDYTSKLTLKVIKKDMISVIENRSVEYNSPPERKSAQMTELTH